MKKIIIEDLNKARVQVKGFTRTRKGKIEQVKPYEAARADKIKHLITGKPEKEEFDPIKEHKHWEMVNSGKFGEPFSATTKQMEHEIHRMSTMSDKALKTRVYKIGSPEKLIRFYAVADQLQKPELKSLIKKIGKEKFNMGDEEFEPMAAWQKKKSPKPEAPKHTEEEVAELAGIVATAKKQNWKKLGEPRVAASKGNKNQRAEWEELSDDDKDTYDMFRTEGEMDHARAMRKLREMKDMPKHDIEDMMYQQAVGKAVEIETIDALYKAQVKPFSRTRKGKFEQVKGYNRNIPIGSGFKGGFERARIDEPSYDSYFKTTRADEEFEDFVDKEKEKQDQAQAEAHFAGKTGSPFSTKGGLGGLWEAQYAPREAALLKLLTPSAKKEWEKTSLARKIKVIDNFQSKGYFERGGEPFSTKKPSTPEEHKIKIAKDTLNMPDAMAGVMGGPTKEEAQKTLNVPSTFSTKERTGPRAVHMIAQEIAKDWKNPYFGAVPYLNAMHALETIETPYGADSGAAVIAYFLANAQTWKGETAKAIKKELNAMLKTKWKKSLEDDFLDNLIKAESKVKSHIRNINGKIVNVKEHQRYKLRGMLNFIRNYKEAGESRGSTLKKLQSRFGLSTEMAHRVHRLSDALGGSFNPFPMK